MKHNQLFLLKPNFRDGGQGPYYCPGCAEVVGLLEFYPTLKQHLDVHYLDFSRPRPAVVDLLGAENQSCPVLVLAEVPVNLPAQLGVQQANGHAFVEGAREIATYWAHVHGTGIPH